MACELEQITCPQILLADLDQFDPALHGGADDRECLEMFFGKIGFVEVAASYQVSDGTF